MKKRVMLLTSLGLLCGIGLTAYQVNADETTLSANTSEISPRAFNVYTSGEMDATGAINGLQLQGNNTVTTGEINFSYDGEFVLGVAAGDETDFVFSVPDELAPLVNSENFKKYINGEFHVSGLAIPVDYTYVQNDITVENDGHTIRFRNPRASYLLYAHVDVDLTINLGQAVTDTGIRIPDAENNTTYDFNGAVIGRDEVIDWDIIGENNAAFSLPTYQLDPGWELINQIPTIEPVTDQDTVVSGRGVPGAAIQVKVGDVVIGEGV
ncbi:hypothetical protein D920_00380, partial [Enterococcus faecalis 13-SD-W-01]